MEHSECREGARVRVNTPDNPRYHRKLGTIRKVNPVNVKVDVDGLPRGLNAHPSFLERLEDAPEASAPVVTYEPYVVPPVVGTIVRVPTEARIAGLHVVVGDGTSHGRVVAKIAKLGGDGNRYWRVTPDKLVEVSLEDVKELLPA